MVDIDLTVKFCGVNFRNPIATASHAPCIPVPYKDVCYEVYVKLAQKYYDLGLGAFVTGTITYYSDKEASNWRGEQFFLPIKVPEFAEREGFVSAAKWPDVLFPKSKGIEVVKKCKSKFKDMPIVASIVGPEVDVEGWSNLAEEVVSAGADMLELNLASVMTYETVTKALETVAEGRSFPKEAGVTVGLIPEIAAELIKGIIKAVDVPIIPKITPELGFFRVINTARIYKEAGARGVTCSHAFITVPPPDIYNRGKSLMPTIEGYPIASFWCTVGPWSRFGAYRDVAAVSKYVPGLDVFACGGLVIPEHCIEVMMLGAKAVQLSAGIMWNGISFISKAINFLKKFMIEQGYNKVDEFIGLGLKHIVDMGHVKWPYRVARVDYSKCTGCKVCLDTWCFALYEDNGRPNVNKELCRGCNLCVIRCPQGAISLIYSPSYS